MFQITQIIKDIWERMKEVFHNSYIKVKAWISTITERLNINDKFLHNLNKARYAKKKRTRKKYAKLVFIQN